MRGPDSHRPLRLGHAPRLGGAFAVAVLLMLAAPPGTPFGPGPRTALSQDPAPTPGASPPDSAVTPPPTDLPALDDRYRVYLLTMDQGDEVWELFGHNAILIRDAATGQDLVWNWGLFNFGDADFVPRFLQGTMLYSMGPSELTPFLEAYRRADRTVYANEVLLSQAEARELDEFVRWNYRPENREYIYDYYRDNCSTRVRDALDGVLGGIIRERHAGVVTDRSYRWHSRRLIQVTTWVDQGLSFMVGTRGDRPITEWEAMFLPLEVMELLEGLERPDGAGGMQPVLGPREVLHQADRPETPATPPPFSPVWLALGLAGAAAILALGRPAAGPRQWGHFGFWVAVGAWGAFSGLLGLLLVAVWVTDHVFAQWNVNLFYTSPLALALGLLAPVAALRRRKGGAPARWSARIAALIAVGSLVAVLAELTPLFGQGNGEVIAVALPMNLAVAWALAQRSEPAPPLVPQQ